MKQALFIDLIDGGEIELINDLGEVIDAQDNGQDYNSSEHIVYATGYMQAMRDNNLINQGEYNRVVKHLNDLQSYKALSENAIIGILKDNSEFKANYGHGKAKEFFSGLLADGFYVGMDWVSADNIDPEIYDWDMIEKVIVQS